MLYGFFIQKFIAFNGDAACTLATQFLTLAEQQRATAPIMIGHRLLGTSLLVVGDFAEGLVHLDRALALYDPAAHRPLATRFGQDIGAAILSCSRHSLCGCSVIPRPPWRKLNVRSTLRARWVTPPTLMFALCCTSFTHILCRDYAAANAHIDECVALAEEKSAVLWKALATAQRGCVLALTGKASDAVQTIGAAITGYRSTGSTVFTTLFLSYLALAYADLGKFDDARRCIGEAMTAAETTKERWYEAEINRIAGEIALKSPETDAAKAEAYFERALELPANSKQSPGNSAPR